MRTNIEIDDELMRQAMAIGRFKTKRAAVEAGLAALTRQAAYAGLMDMFGKFEWEGDLDNWRADKRGEADLSIAAE